MNSRPFLFFVIALGLFPLSASTQTADSSIIWNLEMVESITGYTISDFSKPPAVIETTIGKASHFNGIDQALLIKANPIGSAKAFTIEVIFRPDSITDDINKEQRFLHIMKPGFEKCRLLIELRMNKSQHWVLDNCLSSDSSTLILSNRNFSHPAGYWYHVALVFENETATSYVNGNKELTGHIKLFPITDGETSVGVRQTYTSWYNGSMKVIRFTPRALKPEEFYNLHDAPN
jgi:hypothetical protein